MKIIMIGSIEAGISAARKLSGGDRNAKITVYEKGSFYTCGNCGLPHYLTEDMETLKGAIRAKEQMLAAEKIEAHLNHEVVGIDAAKKQVTVVDLTTQRTFTDSYDKLILATGSTNVVPAVQGADKVGVQTLKNVEDLIFLKEFTKTPYVRDICILGGSYAGLEIAKAFHKMGRSVRIIEKNPKLLPEFDPEVSDMIQKELEEEGVLFSMGQTVSRFTGRTYIEKVETNKGSYDCDLCIVAIGVTPNVGLAVSAGVALAKNGAIQINSGLETSVSGIYAVGDCAYQEEGHLRTSSIRVADLEIARTGLTETEAKKTGRRVSSVISSGYDRPGICPNPNRITIKLIYDAATRQVLGAESWGAKNVSGRVNAIAVAVQAGMTVEQLSEVDFVYSSSASSIWDPVQVACLEAR